MSSFKTIKGFSKYEINESGTIVRNGKNKAIVGMDKGGNSIRLYNDAGDRVSINKKDFTTKLIPVDGEAVEEATETPKETKPKAEKKPAKKAAKKVVKKPAKKAAKKVVKKAAKKAAVKKEPKEKKERVALDVDTEYKRLKYTPKVIEKYNAMSKEHPLSAELREVRKQVLSGKLSKRQGLKQLLDLKIDNKSLIGFTCFSRPANIYSFK